MNRRGGEEEGKEEKKGGGGRGEDDDGSRGFLAGTCAFDFESPVRSRVWRRPVQGSRVREGLWSASKSTARKKFELMYEHAAEAKLAFWVKMCTPRRREHCFVERR